MKTNIFLGIVASAILLVSCGKPTEETKPVRKDVTETVFASGTLEANGTYELTSQTDGHLVQVYFEEGDLVKGGQVLAVVDNKQNKFNTKSANALYEISRINLSANSPTLTQAKNSSMVALQRKDLDSINYARYKRLYNMQSISLNEYDNMYLQYQTSKANYANSIENYKIVKQQAEQQAIMNEAQKDVNRNLSGNNEITAVFTGKVYKKLKQKGDFVRKGDVIATIGDPNFIYARVSIDESSISKVKLGQEAIISINPMKGKTFKGKVAEIFPAFDEATQSYTCTLFFTDSLDFRVINTQLQSNIVIGETKNALLIPRNYLKYGDFVEVKGKKQPVKVTARLVSSQWVLIEDGITENDVIITDNIAGSDISITDINK
jgi:multidrug efflux pump subunit AcrA (membrane-fusion protein)